VIPVIVISLPKSIDRRSTIRTHLADLGIPFSFFDAVDGYKMSAADIAAYSPRFAGKPYRKLSPEEIGCAASHRKVVDEISHGANPFVCVLEDDAHLSPDAIYFLDDKFLRQLSYFHALRLVNDPKRTNSLSKLTNRHHGYDICAPLRPGFRTTAQVYSREGSAKIAEGLSPLLVPIDNAIYADCRIYGLRTLEVRPGVAVPSKSISTIGSRESRGRRTVRSIYRNKIFLLARFFRVIRNFVHAWGWAALFSLARYGPSVITQRMAIIGHIRHSLTPAVSDGLNEASLVSNFFGDRQGTFVEVGANDPVLGSQKPCASSDAAGPGSLSNHSQRRRRHYARNERRKLQKSRAARLFITTRCWTLKLPAVTGLRAHLPIHSSVSETLPKRFDAYAL
jgi:glycosyl transferase family 25